MNREIKFRIWHKKKQEFFYFEPFNKTLPSFSGEGGSHYYYSFSNFYCGISKSLNMEPVDIEDIIPQQFTGLLDKNEKEIYEGDIVKYKFKLDDNGEIEEGIGEIYYDEESASFLFDNFYQWDFLNPCLINNSIEIVGNIFGNPKLLK